MLPEGVIHEAFRKSEASDIFLSVGTSAIIHPAASLPLSAKRSGAVLVEINPERTPLSDIADYYVAGKSGELLPELVNLLDQLSAGDRSGRN
jgi:NAD-dependent deacetylase